MKSYVHKTIIPSQKKKASKRNKTKKKTVKKLRSHKLSAATTNEHVEKICCRCELRFKENEHVMGGMYNGVVCLDHRCCSGCWFEKSARGARVFESTKTKSIAMVDKPFKGTIPLCPGCKKGLPPYEIKPKPTSFTVADDGVVYIDDSD